MRGAATLEVSYLTQAAVAFTVSSWSESLAKDCGSEHERN